ncbi:MAG: hypothetical protein M1378_11255 [Bacteroidetes bacterium]|nr:hypothetical protein [Bacteroidota bacterium]
MRKLLLVGLSGVVLTFFVPAARAQFVDQMNYIGPHIGLSGVGSALTLGLDYERGITTPGQVGPGVIGIGGLFDYYSYGDAGLGGNWTYIDIGVSGMYHFVLSDKQWDPFLGLVLGYEAASWSWNSNYNGLGLASPTAGGFTLGGSAGVRYFFNNNWAAQARVGFGFYVLALGVDYSF